MDFNIIFKSSTSVTLELLNNDIYLTQEYSLYLNNELYLDNQNKNVVSIYNLKPDTEYEVLIKQGNNELSKKFKTDYEYVCLNVLDFGAKGDGKSLDTSFIQAAILACPDNGRVYFPEGTYYTGPLFLRSNITIELSKGARLLGDVDRNHYPILPGLRYTSDEKDEYNLGSWEGNPLDIFASIITGINVENVKIIGEGIIDGNAKASDWWVDVRTRRIAWRGRGLFLNHSKMLVFKVLL